MKTNIVRLALLTYSCLSFVLVGAGIVLPAWIAFNKGGTELVGLVLIFTGAFGLALAPVAGHLVDRHDKRAIAVAGQAFRALGLLILISTSTPLGVFTPAVLVLSGVVGGFGFSIQMGALSALTQINVAVEDRTKISFQLSIAKQIGIAVGTGLTGVAIDRLGSTITGVIFSALALLTAFLLRHMRSSGHQHLCTKTSGFKSASLQALVYLRQSSAALSATFAVGMAFAVIQTTNLLLPGFVVNMLRGGSKLFGIFEMAAAVAGFIAVGIASTAFIADKLRLIVIPLLTATGLSLVLFSTTTDEVLALAVYTLAGVLWSISRAAADASLLTVVETSLIGRVQAFTTLITGLIGMSIYLLPTLFSGMSEARLYSVCGTLVAAISACMLIVGRPQRRPGM